jgi:hypothetical protein
MDALGRCMQLGRGRVVALRPCTFAKSYPSKQPRRCQAKKKTAAPSLQCAGTEAQTPRASSQTPSEISLASETPHGDGRCRADVVVFFVSSLCTLCGTTSSQVLLYVIAWIAFASAVANTQRFKLSVRRCVTKTEGLAFFSPRHETRNEETMHSRTTVWVVITC